MKDFKLQKIETRQTRQHLGAGPCCGVFTVYSHTRVPTVWMSNQVVSAIQGERGRPCWPYLPCPMFPVPPPA